MLVLTLVFFGLFVVLGNWQLQRADYKRGIEQRFKQRLQQPAEYLKLDQKPDENLVYRRVRLKGRYDMQHVLLLDNQLYQGKAGYQVLIPFLIEHKNQAVWVNRGWVAADYNRQILPDILPPRITDRVEGILTLPSKAGYRLGEVTMTDSWPQRVPFLDLSVINRALAIKLLPYVIWEDPSMNDYYVRDWKPVWMPPEKSEAYALQWFSFAAIVLVLFVVLNTKKITRETIDE